MNEPLRVAVIGASGIGQHHARWYHLCGCDVVAFVGTSTESCERTRDRLAAYFGFSGRSYTDIEEMLKEEKPDIVDVSTPPQFHKEHSLAALAAGAHVMCEKPFVWDVAKPLEEILEDGREIVDSAGKAGRLLGVCSQYPGVIPIYRSFYEGTEGALQNVDSLTMEMEVKSRKEPKFREDIWIDVASHPLSLVVGFMPGGHIDLESARCAIEERENRAAFDYIHRDGKCRVEFVLRDIDEGDPIRRFGVNGFLVDWLGFPDEQGIFRAELRRGDQAVQGNDFMHILIEEFVSAVNEGGGEVVVSGEDGLLNVKHQAELLDLARQ